MESDPRGYARIAGVLYLGVIVLGIVAEAARDTLVVPGNAALTAAHLVAHETLWRIGLVSETVMLVCVTTLTMIYFVLFRPVSRELNLLTTFLRLIAIEIQFDALHNLWVALFPLETEPLLTMMSIRAHGYEYSIALLLFGVCFLVHGYLIRVSRFLPRILGTLIQIAGVCYVVNSLALFLTPTFQNRIFPFVLLPSFVGELSLALWLLIKGVDADAWRAVNSARA